MGDSKDLHLLGVSFRTAPVAVRESLSFNRSEAAALLQGPVARGPELEALVLSTCNRTEFYLAAPREAGAVETMLAHLRRIRPQAPILRSDCLRYQASGAEAARHLFRVACGLDSAVLGDVQILGQVKEALAVASECGTLGSCLNRLGGQALRAGKRARAETLISQGAASIGSALAGMLSRRWQEGGMGRAPKILILGAGQIARDIGRHLSKRHVGELTFINRTAGKAEELARHCGGQAVEWSCLGQALEGTDVAIAATAAPQPILQRDLLDYLAVGRAERPLLLVDAGLPRNVEAGSALEVIDIDAIRERQETVLAQRREAIPGVEEIVEEELRAWEQWRAALPIEDAIKQLYQEAAARSREAAPKLAAPGAFTQSEAEEMIFRSFKQLLHRHVRRLRDLSYGRATA
jgi:glutamyl-tRNA reductase